MSRKQVEIRNHTLKIVSICAGITTCGHLICSPPNLKLVFGVAESWLNGMGGACYDDMYITTVE